MSIKDLDRDWEEYTNLLSQHFINKMQKNLKHREKSSKHATERQTHNKLIKELIKELSEGIYE